MKNNRVIQKMVCQLTADTETSQASNTAQVQVTAAETNANNLGAIPIGKPEQGVSMSNPKFWAPYEKFVQEFLAAHQRPGELNDEQRRFLVQQLSLCFRRYQHLVDKTHKHHAEAIKEVDDYLKTSGVTFPKNTKHLQKAICIYLGLHGKNLDMHKVNSYCAALEFAEMCEIYPSEFFELVEQYDGIENMCNAYYGLKEAVRKATKDDPKLKTVGDDWLNSLPF